MYKSELFKQARIAHINTILPFNICREILTIASYGPKQALRNSSHKISVSVRGHNGQEREQFHHAVVQWSGICVQRCSARELRTN